MRMLIGYTVAPEHKRVLGVFHFLKEWLNNYDETGSWKLYRAVEVHEDRLKRGYTPCMALEFPCFHPFYHGGTITVKIGPRSPHAPA